MRFSTIRKFAGLLCRGRKGRDSGAAAAELAITAPMLVFLVLGIADYGNLMSSAAALIAGTRAGAEVARANPSITASQLTALNIFPSGATPNVSPPFCTCVDNTPQPCGAPHPCAGNTDTRVLKYLTVSADQNFTPLFSVTNFLNIGSLNLPKVLNASATVRLQ
jgi:Flp pilus assembly protein TadG